MSGGSIKIQTPPSNTAIHSHLALIIGQISPSPGQGASVSVTCAPHPPIQFPVHSNGRFKALAPLTPGENAVSIQCGGNSIIYPIFYQPLQTRPVSLIIVAARDSPLQFDDVYQTNLDMAVRRFRMAAYLWQAYTSEQMMRAGFGPRTFQFELEHGVDSVTRAGVHGQIPKVTLVRSNQTMAEIRDANKAQQNEKAGGKQDLYGMAREAIKNAPEFRGRGNYLQAACLIMDATHDRNGMILGHAALGGAGDPFPTAIFGSHTCFSWPESLEDVVPAFMSRQPVDTRACAIDCEGKDYGMAANVGIGAMMHEVGHMLTCPHQTYGVMLRDYTRLHESFIAIQPDDSNECRWHRLDALRFLAHPSFALPNDSPLPQNKGAILVTAAVDGLSIYTPSSAILAIEYRKPGKETADPFVDLAGKNQNQYGIARHSLNGFDRITVLATDGGKLDDFAVENIWPNRQGVLRSAQFGRANGQPQSIGVPPNLSHIRVYCGASLDGIELNGALFGKRGGSPKDWPLNPGETVMGINVRHGAWMDAIQFVTTQRTSPWFGNGAGGGPGEARVPSGYRWSGVYGHVGQWCNGVGFEFEPIGQQYTPAPPQQSGYQQQQQQHWTTNQPQNHHHQGGLGGKISSFLKRLG